MDSRNVLVNRHRHLFNVFSPKPANILQTAEFEVMVKKSIIFWDTSSTSQLMFEKNMLSPS